MLDDKLKPLIYILHTGVQIVHVHIEIKNVFIYNINPAKTPSVDSVDLKWDS